MFKAIGKPAKFVYVPTQIFDFSISLIEFIAKTWPSQKWEDALETAKIGSKSLFGNTVWFTSYCASLTILHMFQCYTTTKMYRILCSGGYADHRRRRKVWQYKYDGSFPEDC